jgi:hypothetical protein
MPVDVALTGVGSIHGPRTQLCRFERPLAARQTWRAGTSFLPSVRLPAFACPRFSCLLFASRLAGPGALGPAGLLPPVSGKVPARTRHPALGGPAEGTVSAATVPPAQATPVGW